MKEAATLVVRADGGPAIGLGHVMRSLALAQAWKDAGGRCAWACRELPAGFEARLLAEGMSLDTVDAARGSRGDSDALTAIARREGASWALIDGYRFDSAYQDRLSGAGFRVLWLDDEGRSGPFTADLVLNQNLGAQAGWYARSAPRTRLLLGTDYVLLRREFRARPAPARRFDGPATKVAITLGGGETGDAIRKVLSAAERHAGLETRVLRDVADMPAAMEWADLAITGAGSTVWEAAQRGLPMLVVVMGDDQRANAQRLESAGVAVNLGEIGMLGPEHLARTLAEVAGDGARRETMSRRGRTLVDGNGVERVLAAMGARAA